MSQPAPHDDMRAWKEAAASSDVPVESAGQGKGGTPAEAVASDPHGDELEEEGTASDAADAPDADSASVDAAVAEEEEEDELDLS